MYVEHLRIPIGSGAMHVERAGRGGPPVVFLHGFGTCTFLWRRQLPWVAMRGGTGIAIDLLGHGESDRPADATYALDAQAECVARAMAALRLPSAALVGQGIGALVALLVAAAAPERVSSVAMLAAPDPDDLPGADVRQVQRLSAKVALAGNSLFAARAALAPLLQSGVTDPAHMPDLLVARYLAPWVGPDGLSQLLQRAGAVELSAGAREALGTVTGPVLDLAAGAEPPRPSLSWAALLPKATVTAARLPGGRLLPEDAPDALTEHLTAWLDGQRTT